MDFFLLHCTVLLWLSVAAARPLAATPLERLLAAGLLAWGNIVVTGLLLSVGHRLGDASWFFGGSLTLGVLTWVATRRLQSQIETSTNAAERLNRWLVGAVVVVVAAALAGNIILVIQYPPRHPEALAWEVPRALYYLGQGSLAHFDATDLRQTRLPFNYTLLQVFALGYHAPLHALNFFNLLAWIGAALGVYRASRLVGAGPNTALLAGALVVITTPVIAQAATTTAELPAGVALLCALVFGLRATFTRGSSPRFLAGLAAGLAAGSSLLVLFAVALAAVAMAFVMLVRRRSGLRPWAAPALLAAAIALPFALPNLVQRGPFLPLSLLGQPAANLWSPPLPGTSTPLNEDTASFGLPALLFLLGAGAALVREDNRFRWLAALGLGWFTVVLLAGAGIATGPRALVPAWLLLAPSVALALEPGREPTRAKRRGLILLTLACAAAAFWSTRTFLLDNDDRPLRAALQPDFISPAPPAVPLLLEYRLTREARLNVNTDAVDEPILPLLSLGRKQAITSHRQTETGAYNLFSRGTAAKNAPFLNSTGTSYIVVAVPSKPTAGVEFLGTLNLGPGDRDYLGLERDARTHRPIESNRKILVTIQAPVTGANVLDRTRVRVSGLNPQDHMRLELSLKFDDGRIESVLTFETDGMALVRLPLPFRLLVCRVYATEPGAELGSAAIPYRSEPGTGRTEPLDEKRPSDPSSVFVTDLVLSRKPPLGVEGLLPVEGPFAQWDLPFLRWAREPAVIIRIPPMEKLDRLHLSASVRLHVRHKAALDVIWNGRPVQRYRIDESATWVEVNHELTVQPGENVLEFRDAPLNAEPDWLAYLELYPDVKQDVLARGSALEQGAREHYESLGKAEHRTLPTVLRPEPAPDGYYFMFRHIRLEGFKTP